VPVESLDAAINCLRSELARPLNTEHTGSERLLRAYISYVLALSGKPQHGWMNRQLELEYSDSTAIIYLAAALAVSGERREAAEILKKVSIAKLSRSAHETDDSLSSPVRDIAMLLLTRLNIDPEAAEVSELVNQLNNMKTDGRWITTQENALALMALAEFSRTTQQQPREFSAAVKIDRKGKIEHRKFNNRLNLLPEQLSAGAGIELKNDGPGTLYYSLITSGVPLHAAGLPAESHGVEISRELYDISGRRLKHNRLKQGQPAVVKISVNTHGLPLHNIVIEDLLPAGLEIENAALKTSQTVAWIKKREMFKVRHTDIRDDRLVIFPDELHGIENFYYVVRAVTRGSFIYPAISCECMYSPNIRARGAVTHFTVEK
jgi:uncharacterized protein YfaS (alpha-2-macroglobulin family)